MTALNKEAEILKIKKELQKNAMAGFHSDKPYTEVDDKIRMDLIVKLEELQKQEGGNEMLYCIEVERECDDKAVLHKHFDHEPTEEEVIAYINDEEDMDYDDDYGRLNFYKVIEKQERKPIEVAVGTLEELIKQFEEQYWECETNDPEDIKEFMQRAYELGRGNERKAARQRARELGEPIDE